MSTLLAFAPFILFVIIERLVGVAEGLAAAAIVAAVLIARDLFTRGKSAKVLEIGTFILFGGLAAYAFLAAAALPIAGVRLGVDAGLLLIVLISIAIRQPFTLQYAREQVPAEHWDNPGFVRVNYAITAVWALAFAVMAAADLAMLSLPDLPKWISIAATVAAIVGAVRFTSWYPEHAQAAAAKPSPEPARKPS